MAFPLGSQLQWHCWLLQRAPCVWVTELPSGKQQLEAERKLNHREEEGPKHPAGKLCRGRQCNSAKHINSVGISREQHIRADKGNKFHSVCYQGKKRMEHYGLDEKGMEKRTFMAVHRKGEENQHFWSVVSGLKKPWIFCLRKKSEPETRPRKNAEYTGTCLRSTNSSLHKDRKLPPRVP